MIKDPMGAEIRPTLHVPFRDYDELLKENKRLREALETTEKTYLRAFRSGISDEIWFEYFQPLVGKVKEALYSPRAVGE